MLADMPETAVLGSDQVFRTHRYTAFRKSKAKVPEDAPRTGEDGC